MSVFIQPDYHRILLYSLICTCVVSVTFIAFPSLDILASQLFWNQQEGFYLRENALVVFFARYNYVLAMVYLIVTFSMVAFYKLYRCGFNYQHSIFLFSSLMLGSGLLVNALLKSFWGRARPLTIEAFGGTQTFSPAWYISDQCASNCSFVSGHTAAAFAFYAFVMLFFQHTRLRLYAFCSVTVFGLIAGFTRIIEGKHFLSDIIISGHLVWLVALLCYFPIWKAHSTRVSTQPIGV